MKKLNGFSLLELVVVITITGIVASVVGLLLHAYFLQQTQHQQDMLQNRGLLNGVHLIQQDVTALSSNAIIKSTQDTFEFKKSDGKIIQYHWNAGQKTLFRKEDDGADYSVYAPLATLSFRYATSNATGLLNIVDDHPSIQWVNINLTTPENQSHSLWFALRGQ